MDVENEINERVEVVARYQSQGLERENCIPVYMQYKNRWYNFSKLGYVHPTISGDRMRHVYDVTDEETHFRLEHDCESEVWYLKSMGYGKYVPERTQSR